MAAPPLGIFIVVVLYQRALDASPTCVSLLDQTFVGPRDVVLVYDNSAVSNLGPVPFGWEVVKDSSNGGLVAAYSCAVSRAKSAGCPWILLLDQDTQLPRSFFSSLHENVSRTREAPDVVAIVPIIMAGKRQVSPMIPRLGRENPFLLRDVIETNWLMAINSGACIRVDFIEGIGGFAKEYWLDFLDHWLFKMVHSKRKSVYVSGVVLQHELSVANMNNGLTVPRYRNVLSAERHFTNNHLPWPWRLVLALRLIARASKHLVVTRDKQLGLLMIAGAGAQMKALLRDCWVAIRPASAEPGE
jgi:GT2 family glycosyltransferase